MTHSKPPTRGAQSNLSAEKPLPRVFSLHTDGIRSSVRWSESFEFKSLDHQAVISGPWTRPLTLEPLSCKCLFCKNSFECTRIDFQRLDQGALTLISRLRHLKTSFINTRVPVFSVRQQIPLQTGTEKSLWNSCIKKAHFESVSLKTTMFPSLEQIQRWAESMVIQSKV